MIKRFKVLFILFTVFLSANCFGVEETKPTPRKKILLIHSYHPEYAWVQEITEGVEMALEGKNVDLEIFYMDTKRNTSEAWKLKSGELAKKKIDELKPDVVITADDNAQILVAQYYVNKKPFFVFCGVNGDPEDYGFPASNITGVIERPFFEESLSLLKKVYPNKIRKLAFVSDDCPTSEGALDYMRKLPESSETVFSGFYMESNFSAWKERIKSLNVDVDALAVYMYHTIEKEERGLSMAPEEVMQWTIANCQLPTLGFFDFAINDGLLCGVVESGQEQGFEAAVMALELLNGKDIKSLPIRKASRGTSMVNLATARKLGIIIPEEVLKEIDNKVE